MRVRGRFRQRKAELSEEDCQLLAALRALVPATTAPPWWRSWEKLSRIGAVTAGVIALAALGFTARQTQISADANTAAKDALQASAWAAATQATLQVDQAFAQADPQGRLMPYFNGGLRLGERPRPATQPDRALFEHLAIMQLDLLDGYWGLVSFLPGTFIDRQSVGRWMRFAFANSPELCRVLGRFQDTYGDELVNRAADACQVTGQPLKLHRDLKLDEAEKWSRCIGDKRDTWTAEACVRPTP
jgi:hypothetical protein